MQNFIRDIEMLLNGKTKLHVFHYHLISCASNVAFPKQTARAQEIDDAKRAAPLFRNENSPPESVNSIRFIVGEGVRGQWLTHLQFS